MTDPTFSERRPEGSSRRGGPGPGAMGALVLALVAGGIVYAVTPRRLLPGMGRESAPEPRHAREETEVVRSIMVERELPEALAARWRDTATLVRILAPYADVEPLGEDLTRWRAGPLGEWTMRRSDTDTHEVRWTAEDESAPLREFAARFTEARRSGAAIVSLRMRLAPPGGMLGRAVARFGGDLLPGAVATRAIHSFKALAETGEIPTTEGQPAARADTR